MPKKKFKERSSREWPCQKCGYCCTIVPLKGSIIREFRRSYQRPVIEERRINESDTFSVITEDAWCVFKKPDGQCAIYEYRPEICRIFGHSSGLLECPRFAPSGRIRSPQEVQRVFTRIQKLSEEGRNHDLSLELFGLTYKNGKPKKSDK
jgi:Fe-S-cluster containining protein